MPLIAHNDLPAFARLDAEGVTVLEPHRALNQDIRELHFGLLNMMPDKALAATERQFLRLIGDSNPIAQFYVHPFTLPQIERSAQAQQHIDNYYESFEQIREQGLDALIITGANVVGSHLADQPFWQPLIEVIDWAYSNVTSTLCSCLATHAVLEFRYAQPRRPQKRKVWGVFKHRLINKRHPLISDVNTRFDVPHSRWNAIEPDQFAAAGLRVLAQSEEVGVHLATSADGLRFVFFQGHPEYDTVSLIKEFKREVLRYADGQLSEFPPFPDAYFDLHAQALIREFALNLRQAMLSGAPLPEMPESLIIPHLDNTWQDSARSVVGNWLGLVYQVTHQDRRRPFMDGIDPQDPLGLKLAAD